MKTTIEDIRKKLKGNEYKNKEHFRISLVARILQKLGWDLWNPNEFYPEFAAVQGKEQSKVSLALLIGENTPSAFIEIKPADKFEQNVTTYESQLPDNKSIKTYVCTILTDGGHWRFYYSKADENILNNCFKTLNILEDDTGELVSAFETYLSKNNISNGNAQSHAKQSLLKLITMQAIKEVLPKARLMVHEPPYPRLPQAIIELITPKGIKISEDEVIKILEINGSSQPSSDTSPLSPPAEKPAEKNERKTDNLKRNIKNYVFLGKMYKPSSWQEMLINICGVIYESHVGDFDKCLKIGNESQLYFSKNMNDLIEHAPAKIGNSEYYVRTEFNEKEIIELIQRIIVIFGYNTNDIKISLG